MMYVRKNKGGLLRKLVSPLVQIQLSGAVICRLDYLTVQVSAGFLTGALRLKSSTFNCFICNGTTKAWVGLDDLNRAFLYVTDYESIALRISDDPGPGDVLTFVYKHRFYSRDATSIRLRFRPVPEHHPDINESEFEYEVVVGIPSEEFCRIFRHFSESEEPMVEAFVTDEEVTFRGGDSDVVLTPESGDCVIGGMDEYSMRVNIRIFLLGRLDSIIEASQYCSWVWFLKSRADHSPDMINCPLGALGNFLFYTTNWRQTCMYLRRS
ncbi:proliferating cell nuclear antigen large form-like [Actinidia eriantha]|uniref:proliferating cell nuclear antigen large form-like n=1 Tax=Actinidia eriantha TaxID=165200 RepID=UPI00258ED712|nr:proliferating cell nuclear antigen large form-like [Actinidia eriantha]